MEKIVKTKRRNQRRKRAKLRREMRDYKEELNEARPRHKLATK